MSQARTAFVLLVVFFAGCAAERRLVVPPARAGTNPQRWEYARKDGRGEWEVNNTLNQMGQQGWELVTADPDGLAAIMFFKRPLP
jgi:hypothetical protein